MRLKYFRTLAHDFQSAAMRTTDPEERRRLLDLALQFEVWAEEHADEDEVPSESQTLCLVAGGRN
jgi:hypothetical protein